MRLYGTTCDACGCALARGRDDEQLCAGCSAREDACP
jgi:uncharacterized Zn finger protein (UPF0148 family)